MKLKNIKEVEEFRKVIHACAGDVYLKSQDGDVFNLKSALSEYIALGQLLSEQGDNLELFADRREDEARLINFLAELDKENENGFIFYQSEDENSGQFTYFAFSPDTMETTYHLEFRYAEDLSDLQSWFEGNYAYWNAAAIAENYDQATMENVIELFVTENLSNAE